MEDGEPERANEWGDSTPVGRVDQSIVAHYSSGDDAKRSGGPHGTHAARARRAPTNRVGMSTRLRVSRFGGASQTAPSTDVAVVPCHDSRVIFCADALVVKPGRLRAV